MAVTSILLVACLVVLGNVIRLAVYRLYLSPIAKFPGPKLAALTRWYEAYYEIYLKGQFSFHIDDLHRQYGPIVRIAPEELHIKDPSSWEMIYVKPNKASRYEWSSGRFGNNSSVFTTADPNLHKIRRAPLNNMFSRRAILGFEPVVQEKLQKLCNGLSAFHKSGGVCKISEAFSAFAGDVVTSYCFGFDYDHLSVEGFGDSFHEAFKAATEFGHVALQFPWMLPLLMKLPDNINKAMNPALAKVFDSKRDIEAKISSVKQDLLEGGKPPDHPTIFHSLLESSLPEPEKSSRRLTEEAQNMIGAGVETTAWVFCQAAFHILSNPQIHSKLVSELVAAFPDLSPPHHQALEYTSLETLPYLRGCVKEAIRLSLGVSGRNQRVLPEPLVYGDWTIPAHTPVSMTNTDVLLNDGCFEEARRFVPERWMGESPKAPDGEALEKYFVAFGKGARSCLGINLAHMELFLVLGTVFRKFEMELYETDETDVAYTHDFFLPSPKLDSKGIRVRVVGVRE